jgi:hypothetical protein
LRQTLAASSRTLREVYRNTSRETAALQSRSIACLLTDWWFIDSQLGELSAALSKEFCRKLQKAARFHREPESRVYGVIDSILGCVISSAFGPLALGKLLTTEALAELFGAGRLGASLSLVELWAIPPVVKLVLIEKLAQLVSTPSAAADQREREAYSIIECLHSLDRIRWSHLIESISSVHRLLSADPAGVYPRMEFESRDLYRRAVEALALEAHSEEEYIAQLAVVLAREAQASGGKKAHVGYYLTGAGVRDLRSRGKLRRSVATCLRDVAYRLPNLAYISATAVLTTAFTALIAHFAGPLPWWWIALVALASSQTATTLVNLLVGLTMPPRRIPRLDFSQGIPEEYSTFVIVPTLLLSQTELDRMLERLEIHYLANRDPNLVFGLLTDFPDTDSPNGGDQALLDACAAGIQSLNRRYGAAGESRFFLFHRKSEWNESQQKWMGRERKRGKLEDFNRFLLGIEDVFALKSGDLSTLPPIRYVITLDSDTQLPRDAAWKLVGSLAHPLQTPIVDPVSKTVREGYAILQPLSSVSMESAGRSRFAQILSGQTGLDPYATSASNVYQDLHGQASFTGKGIYDLRAFHEVLDGRFPDNSLLSHDLIEGEHTGAAVVTDVDMIEDVPGTYETYCRRKHRWVRGDWQLLPWLNSSVPDGRGRRIANPLPLVSRWKIADNLRRSLFEIALLFVLLTGWALSARPVPVLLAAAAILLLPAYANFTIGLFRLPAVGLWRGHLEQQGAEFRRAHGAALLALVSLPHQALLMADAILRTLVRRYITRRNLLEWQSMAQTEAGAGKGRGGFPTLLVGGALAACFAVFIGGHATWPMLLVMALWLASPFIIRFINGLPRRGWPEQPNELQFLRDVGLRTWRYFSDFSRREDHWLVPDNVQEDPECIARRVSPTNLGLQIGCNVAAFDFGYLTGRELAIRNEQLLGALRQLETHRGHIYNWYDTETLEPLTPRYVSTVDSGNLAAALITLKQTCEGMDRQRLVEVTLLAGLRDYCLRLRQSLPSSARNAPTMRAMANLIRLVSTHPASLFSWQSLLTEVASAAQDLNEYLAAAGRRLETRRPQELSELSYWQDALNRRIQSALDGLHELAPWLKRQDEEEWQEFASRPQCQDLMMALSRIPELRELPGSYDEIESAIYKLLDAPEEWPGEYRGLLFQLSGEVRHARSRARVLLNNFQWQARIAGRLVDDMDFAFLFDSDRDLMHIGYNVDAGRLDDCYYNLLASEARTAVFLAVAKGDVPNRTWFKLGRKATSFRGHRTLLSWSGTMFEYLMPSLFMKTFHPTLLGRSLTGAVQAQRAYARELSVPWGMSESSCSARNQERDYGYYAFGIPGVSLRRLHSRKIVIAPYASMLALMVDRQSATDNLRLMASRGWSGRYGFFEAVEFQREACGTIRRSTVVRSFMAHHQGMGLLALCNAVLDGAMQKRFHAEPMVAATELLLQERVPAPFISAEESLDEPVVGEWAAGMAGIGE